MKHRFENAVNITGQGTQPLPARPPAQSLPEKLAPLFDAPWYLLHYPDVAAAGVDPLQHYINHGAAEGRDPHPLFSVKWYLSLCPGDAEASMNPLLHYIDHGAGEGRDPHPRFDTGWYLARHPDAAAAGTNPLQHYVARHGSDRGALVPYIVEKINAIRSDTSLWPPDASPTAEAGIVISACSRLFRPLYANLRIIREHGCTLPIDIWHLPGEFTAGQAAFLGTMARLVDGGETPFNGLSGRHEVHGFKAWMLSRSRFEKTFMLDVNCFPLQNPELVFQSRASRILWRDGPWEIFLRDIAELRRSLHIAVHPFEFESGQLYVDKRDPGARGALRLAAAMNTLGPRLYAYTWGDKETYALAFDLLGGQFSIAPAPATHRIDPAASDHGGLIQPWLDGTGLFYHPLRDKDCWWDFKSEWKALEQEAAEAEKRCL